MALMTLLFFSITTPVSGTITHNEANGKVTIQTDQLNVVVTSNNNVPAYSFGNKADTNASQNRVQFDRIFEFQDTNNNSHYDTADTIVTTSVTALASLQLQMNAVTELNGLNAGINFNMSLTAKALVSLNFDRITFDNHVTTMNQSQLKFDVIINNYNFISQTSMLAVAFKMSSKVSNQTTMDHNKQQSSLQFGQHSYFASNNTAMAGDAKINASLSQQVSTNGQHMIYLSYPHFSGKLVHDPSMGVTQNQVSSSYSVTTNQKSSSTSAMPLEGFGVLGTLLAIPIFYRRKIQA